MELGRGPHTPLDSLGMYQRGRRGSYCGWTVLHSGRL